MRTKPHITPIWRDVSDWPGAMRFLVEMPNDRARWVEVDTWEKLAWSIDLFARNPSIGGMIDLGA